MIKLTNKNFNHVVCFTKNINKSLKGECVNKELQIYLLFIKIIEFISRLYEAFDTLIRTSFRL